MNRYFENKKKIKPLNPIKEIYFINLLYNISMKTMFLQLLRFLM